jgi:hypothetical protein
MDLTMDSKQQPHAQTLRSGSACGTTSAKGYQLDVIKNPSAKAIVRPMLPDL